MYESRRSGMTLYCLRLSMYMYIEQLYVFLVGLAWYLPIRQNVSDPLRFIQRTAYRVLYDVQSAPHLCIHYDFVSTNVA